MKYMKSIYQQHNSNTWVVSFWEQKSKRSLTYYAWTEKEEEDGGWVDLNCSILINLRCSHLPYGTPGKEPAYVQSWESY